MMLKKFLQSLFLALSISTAAIAADKVDINTATQAQLEMLNGIGSSIAAAIIDYREQHGAYSSVEELVNVKGIGDKKLSKLADWTSQLSLDSLLFQKIRFFEFSR